MKNGKKLLAIVVLLVLLILPVSAVGASALGEKMEAKPGETCPWCGKGTMVYCKTQYTPWIRSDRQLCVHGDPWWVDAIEERMVFVSYHCSNESCDLIRKVYGDDVVVEDNMKVHCVEQKSEEQAVQNHK